MNNETLIKKAERYLKLAGKISGVASHNSEKRIQIARFLHQIECNAPQREPEATPLEQKENRVFDLVCHFTGLTVSRRKEILLVLDVDLNGDCASVICGYNYDRFDPDTSPEAAMLRANNELRKILLGQPEAVLDIFERLLLGSVSRRIRAAETVIGESLK